MAITFTAESRRRTHQNTSCAHQIIIGVRSDCFSLTRGRNGWSILKFVHTSRESETAAAWLNSISHNNRRHLSIFSRLMHWGTFQSGSEARLVQRNVFRNPHFVSAKRVYYLLETQLHVVQRSRYPYYDTKFYELRMYVLSRTALCNFHKRASKYIRGKIQAHSPAVMCGFAHMK